MELYSPLTVPSKRLSPDKQRYRRCGVLASYASTQDMAKLKLTLFEVAETHPPPKGQRAANQENEQQDLQHDDQVSPESPIFIKGLSVEKGNNGCAAEQQHRSVRNGAFNRSEQISAHIRPWLYLMPSTRVPHVFSSKTCNFA